MMGPYRGKGDKGDKGTRGLVGFPGYPGESGAQRTRAASHKCAADREFKLTATSFPVSRSFVKAQHAATGSEAGRTRVCLNSLSSFCVQVQGFFLSASNVHISRTFYLCFVF